MNPNSQPASGKPILVFRQKNAWGTWLDKNYGTSSGVWLRLAKKASGLKSMPYDQALDVALCYGWIDGQGKSDAIWDAADEQYSLRRFTG